MRISLMLTLVNIIAMYCVSIYMNMHYNQAYFLEALVGCWIMTYFGGLLVWPKEMINELKRVL